MKKILLLLAITAVAFAIADAQTLSSKKMQGFYAATKKLDKTTYKLSPDQITGTGTITLLTPDVNLTFTRIQKSNGNWTFGGSFTPGISYNFVIGQATKNADGSVLVNPYFSIGAFGDFGAVQSPTGSFVTAVDFGGCIGLYRYITVAGGVDVISQRPFFAVGTKVSIFSFGSGSGATILSFK